MSLLAFHSSNLSTVSELMVEQTKIVVKDRKWIKKENKWLITIGHLVLLIILAFFLVPTNATSVFDKHKVNILVLLSYDTSLPWTVSFVKGLEEARKSYHNRVNYYIESMDSARLKNMGDEKWANYLQNKYQSIHFDAVVSESDCASQFVNKNEIIFPDETPFVYYVDSYIKCSIYSTILISQTEQSVEKTYEMALLQNPKAKHIFIIDSQQGDSRLIVDKLITLTKQQTHLKITILNDFSLDSLRKRLMSLPSNSIVFYTLIFRDNTGTTFIPKDFLSTISSTSVAPIYSFWSPLIGSGIVGGEMIDGEQTAIQMVNAVIDYLENGGYKKEYNILKTFIDWNALMKYHIDSNLIPQNSIVINKPISIFEEHYEEIIIAFILTLTLFSMTVTFILIKLKKLNCQLALCTNKAEKLARIDLLTNLNNRYAFFEKGYEACNLAKRLNKPLSVLMIDIDFFKNVNDTFGHFVGDEVIKMLGDIIRRTTREIDISSRIGGEEFAVIVMFSDVSDAANLAYRILKEVDDTIVVIDNDKPQIHFTVSIGVFGGMFVSEGHSLEDALKYADKALYQAKERGRDQVVVYEAASNV